MTQIAVSVDQTVVQPVLKVLQQQLDQLRGEVEGIKIEDQTGVERVLKMGKDAKQLGASVKKQRVELSVPFKNALDNLGDAFRPLEDAALKLEQAARTQLSSYYEQQERLAIEKARITKEEAEQAAEQAQLRAEKAGAPVSPVPVADVDVPVQAPSKRLAQGGGIMKVWTYEVLDAQLVPRQYLTVDTASVTAAVKSGVRDIPGVRIYEKATTVFR